MPIYEYVCGSCGLEFELIVLAGTTLACPECGSQQLERLLSSFAVSSQEIRKSNLKRARAKARVAGDYRDKQIAELEDVRNHIMDDHNTDWDKPSNRQTLPRIPTTPNKTTT